MSYFLAPSLSKLRDEINAAFPRRDKTSDGWIGDPSHAARVSDHNPDWGAPGRRNGVVRAIDIDIDDNDAGRDLRREILNAAIGDPRVWYVISNGVIYSRTYGFAARRYTGSNGHYAHVHVSLVHTEAAEFSTAPWMTDPNKPRLKSAPVSLTGVTEQFVAAAKGEKVEYRPGVQRIQQALNNQYKAGLTLDGFAGKATLDAWGRHEARVGGGARPRVPDARSLAALAKGRWRVVK